MRAELHIEHLAIEGFDALAPDELRAALEGELTRLFAERGVPESLRRGGEWPTVEAPSLSLRPGATAREVGGALGRTLYEGFGR